MPSTKQCWYCGSFAMAKTGSYYTCSKCGATYCELPKLDQSPVIVEEIAPGVTEYRPNLRTVRRAKKGKGRKVKDATNA